MTCRTDWIIEPARDTPICWRGDLCVIGGSCTGVFAAVRAARLGIRVCVVENNTLFGGMAVAAQVNEWHSLYDARFEKQVIGGLTVEVVDRLARRNAIREILRGQRGQFRFNPAELAVELDRLIVEHRIHPLLSTRCVGGVRAGARVTHALIESKSGRGAIEASFFIDASGDGDLLRRCRFEAYQHEPMQPVNLQAIVRGYSTVENLNLREVIESSAAEMGYPTDNSTPWPLDIPSVPELRNVFGPRLNGVDASDAQQLTQAYIDSRLHHQRLCDMLSRATGQAFTLVSFAPALGVRDTWHGRCGHQLTAQELLSGQDFEDTIANGTYPLDVHSALGTSLRYLDGREEIVSVTGQHSWGRWRDESLTPPCYHIPLRSMLPRGADNLLIAGRLIDANREAFGAVRVMVNCNQVGEAAGVVAALALQHNTTPAAVDLGRLRTTLAAGGSIVTPPEWQTGR